MYRPVAFVRIMRPVAGAPRVRVHLNPATNWGGKDAERTNGTNPIRYLLKPQPLRITTDAPIGPILDGRAFRPEKSLHFFLGPYAPFVGNRSEEHTSVLQSLMRTSHAVYCLKK